MSETVPVEFVDPKLLVPNPLREKAKTMQNKEQGRYLMMRDSIIANGIKQALLVQQGTNIILGGHTRCEIALELGLDKVPVQYVDVDADEAEYLLIEDNLDHAEDEHDAMKIAWQCRELQRLEGREQGRPRKNAPAERISSGELANKLNMAEQTFRRYVSLNNLIGPLQILVSAGNIGVKSGATLAGLSTENQKKVYESIKGASLPKSYRMTEQDAKSFRQAFGGGQDEGPSESESEATDEREAALDIEDGNVVLRHSFVPHKDEPSHLVDMSNNIYGLESEDLMYMSHDVDRETITEQDEQNRKIGTTQGGVEAKMDTLKAIKDPEARRAFAVAKAKATLRTYQLTVERAELDVVTDLAVLSPTSYSEVSDELDRLTKSYERATKKFELALEKIQTATADE